MALCCHVQNQIRIGLPHRRRRGSSDGEIHPQQLVAAFALWRSGPIAQILQHLLKAGEIVGEAALVEVEHQVVAITQHAANHGTADVHAFGRWP